MKKLFNRYLSTNYYIFKDKLYKITGEEVWSKRTLVEDLSNVFGYTEKQLKWYIKGWILKQKQNFSFKSFWNPKLVSFPWTFPTVRMRMPIISTDLVPVQPLEMPTGRLAFLDYEYDAGHRYQAEGRIDRFQQDALDIDNLYEEVNF